jgi:hypothetical protein
VLEEHATGSLGAGIMLLVFFDNNLVDMKYLHRPDEFISAILFLLLVERRRLVFLEAIVALANHALDGRELARLLLDTHGICLCLW